MKILVTKSAVLAAAFMVVSSVAGAQGVDELELQLDAITTQLFEAESVVRSDEPADVRNVARLRLEILKYSEALIQNRILVLEGRTRLNFVAPAVEPDISQARSILNELTALEARIKSAREDTERLGGAERSLALRRLETEKLAQTQLNLAYYQARFGIRLPSGDEMPIADTAAKDPVVVRDFQPDDHLARVRDSALHRRQLAGGAWASGWWTVKSEPGSGAVSALNFSSYRRPEERYGANALLEAACEAEQFEISYRIPGWWLPDGASPGDRTMEGTYWLDQTKVPFTQWRISQDGQRAILDGADARELFLGMAEAAELSLELWDSEDSLHSSRFNLAGFLDVAETAILECVDQPIRLTRQDYRLVQTLLNIAGYDAGGADGVWGPRSQSAMRHYQHSAGIRETGYPNRETLELLGLGD